MKLFILTSHYPFVSILLSKLITTHHQHIGGIFIEKTPLLKLIRKLIKKSGWRYALYLVFETSFCFLVLKFKEILRISKAISFQRLAKSFNIPVWTIKDAQSDAFVDRLKFLAPDILFLVDYGRLINGPLLTAAKLGMINFHPGLLPKYKGIAPTFFSLLNRENQFGATIHKITEAVDGGDVVNELRLQTDLKKSLSHHRLRLCFQGAEFISRTMDKIFSDGMISAAQQNNQETGIYGFPSKKDVLEMSKNHQKLINLKDCFSLWKSL
ncbi:MAG: formyltransferase family protein [Patescibacteria group bacterium]